MALAASKPGESAIKHASDPACPDDAGFTISPAPGTSSPANGSSTSPYKARAALLNRAIQEIGMGRYQWQLFGVIGFGWASDNLWPIVTSLILVPVQYEFRVSQPPLLTLAQNIGLLVGALFWGFSCDLFGRRWAFNLTIGITAVFGLAAAGSPSFAAVGVFAALWSVGVGGNLPVDSAIFLEFLPGSHQYLLTVLSVNWAFAQLLANLVAWPLIGGMTCSEKEECTREGNMGWRYFLIAMGGFAMVMFLLRFVFFTLYESPKFLLGQGRHEEAVCVVHQVAKHNGKSSTLSTGELDSLSSEEEEADAEPEDEEEVGDEPTITTRTSQPVPTFKARLNTTLQNTLEPLRTPHLKSLFCTPRAAATTSLLITIWFLIGLAYPLYNAFLPYLQQTRGVQFGDGSTALTYRNSLIIAAVGVPGSLVGGVLVELPTLGRKGTLTLSVLLTGAFLLASTTARTSSALLGWNCAFSFSSALMYAVLYAFTPEVFEARDRGTGNALVGAANRLGGILAPVIALVADVKSAVPVWVSGGMFLAAGGLGLLVPVETRGAMSV